MLTRFELDVAKLSLQPLGEDITVLFQKFGAAQDQAHALRLHSCLCDLGVETNVTIGNSLIFLMSENESFCYAKQVFNKLANKTEYSWNSLIVASVKCCRPHLALEFYHKMQENGFLIPTPFTFIALLKACAMLGDLEKGSELHDVIISQGILGMNGDIASTLINMYSKCGALTKAHDVLVNLPVRDVVSWTALISGYADYGHGDETFACIEKMQHEGISPNARTLVCSLKACCSMELSEKGKEIHVDIVMKGYEGDQMIGNTLIGMYAKCGQLETAQLVFDRLSSRTLVSWTILIVGYSDLGYGEDALSSFDQMRQEQISPDAVTFVGGLKACGSLGKADKGMLLHSEIVKKGLERELVIGSAVVGMYAKYSLLGEAKGVFVKIQNKDVIVWTALIAGYVEHGFNVEAFACLQQMQSDKVAPNALTYVSGLQACSEMGITCIGQEMHAEITIKGMEEESLVVSGLVGMYAKCGRLIEAEEAFEKFSSEELELRTALLAGYVECEHSENTLTYFVELENEGIAPSAVAYVCGLKACTIAGFRIRGLELHIDIVKKGFEGQSIIGNTLIDMYAKFSLLAAARNVFDRLPMGDVISWNALIGGYVDFDHCEEALSSFEEMRTEGAVCGDRVTYLCSLKACCGIGASLMSQEIHSEIAKKGWEKAPILGNALIDTYAKCGLITEAQKSFDGLLCPDVVSWNSLLTAYAQMGKSKHVFRIMDTMVQGGIVPDLGAFNSVINGCSHAGSVNEGVMILKAFSNPDHGIVLSLEHYNCIVDLLGRAGQLEKAVEVISKMPLHPDVVVWHTILGACRNCSNAVLGKHAFDHLCEFDKKTASAYLCMYCIYLQADLPDEAEMVIKHIS